MLRKRLLSALAALVCLVAASYGAAELPSGAVELDGVPVHPTRLLAKARTSGGVDHGLGSVVLLDETLPAALTLPDGKPEPASRETIARRLGTRLETLRASGQYEWVEPDYVVRKASLPTDDYLEHAGLWGLRNTEGYPDIDADDAWQITTGSSSVLVGILDTGLQIGHQEFQGAVWVNPGESGAGRETNRRDDDSDGYVDNVRGANVIDRNGVLTDLDGHGTGIASIIGARANDGAPMVGVAPGVTLLPIRVFNEFGDAFTSDIVDGIRFAIRKQVRILNASFGSTQLSQAMRSAVQDAGNAGILVLAAAGNEAVDNDVTPLYPANFGLPNVLSVTAVDREGGLPSWANRGRASVHLAAPGEGITIATTSEYDSYTSTQGTSASTAYVSGVAALLLSAEPNLGVADLRSRLLETVLPLDSLNGKTVSGGMVNAGFALQPSRVPVSLSLRTSSSLPLEDAEVLYHVHLWRGTRLTNTTVQLRLVDGTVLNGRDDGLGGDEVAGDGVHAIRVPIPSGVTSIKLEFIGFQAGVERVRRTLTPSVTLRRMKENDAFENAAQLDVFTPRFGTFAGTGLETGEPSHGAASYAHSLWWRWTAPSNGTLAVMANYAGFVKNALVVYTGSSLASLQSVARAPVPSFQQNLYVNLRVTAGTTYRIAYASEGPGGDFHISASFESGAAPLNDALNAAFVLPSTFPQTLSGNNRAATIEPFELEIQPGVIGHASVWWKFTSPRSGQLTLTAAPGSFTPNVRVFRGTPGIQLEPVLPSGHLASSYQVVPGETYYIGIYGLTFESGNFSLDVDLTGFSGRPFNDAFSAAVVFPSEVTSFRGTTTDATVQAGEPNPFVGAQSGSVWWTWLAPRSGAVSLATRNHQGLSESRIAVFTGAALSALTLVSEPASPSTPPSFASFNAQAGVTYRIRVTTLGTGWENNGFDLHLLQTPAGVRPENDAFTSAVTIPYGQSYTRTSGSTVGATLETGEPSQAIHSLTGTVWYRFSSPLEAIVNVGVRSVQRHRVMLYRGASLAQLQYVNEAHSTSERAYVRLSAGEVLWILVGGDGGGEGNFDLEVGCDTSLERWSSTLSADHFSTASPLVYAEENSLSIATVETGEPSHAGTTPRASHWWRLAGEGKLEELQLLRVDDKTLEMTLYAGTSLGTLTQIATTVGLLNSRLIVHLVQGRTYYLAVHSSSMTPASYSLFRLSQRSARMQGQSAAVFLGTGLSIMDTSRDSNSKWMMRPPGGEWMDVVEGALWSGADTNTLSVASVTESLNAVELGIARRTVGAWDEPLTNDTVRLSVIPSDETVRFTTQPRSATYVPGAEVTLEATATGSPLTGLTWQRRAAGEATWTAVLANDGRHALGPLSIESAGSLENGTQFRAVANRLGGAPVFSEPATLTMIGIAPANRFLRHPQNVAVVTDQEAVFEVEFERAPGTRLVWQNLDRLTRSWTDFPLYPGWAALRPDGALVLEKPSIGTRGMVVRAVLLPQNAAPILSQSATLAISARPTRLSWTDLPLNYGVRMEDLLAHSQLSLDTQPRTRRGLSLNPTFSGFLPLGVHTFRLTYDDQENGYQPGELTFSVRVLPRTLYLRPESAQRVVGAPIQLSRFLVRGWPHPIEQLVFDEPVALTTPATAASPSGEYPIEIAGARSPNFIVHRYSGTLTLVPSQSQAPILRLNGFYDTVLGSLLTYSGLDGMSNEWHALSSYWGVRYDGTASEINLGVAASNTLRSFTVSAWIRPESGGTPDSLGRTPLLWKGHAASFGLSWIPSTKRVRFEVVHASGTQILETPASLPLGLTSHLAATFTETGGIAQLRLNGELVASASGWQPPVVSNARVHIGGHAASGAYFRGVILEPTLNSRALEGVEIRQLARIGAQSTYLADLEGITHLGGYWSSLPWFGRFYAGPEIPWVYHERHGWIYLSLPNVGLPAVTRNALHFYDPKAAAKGWFTWAYASSEYYPWLWVRQPGGTSSWWRFDPTTGPGARSFRKPTGDWVSEAPGS